MVLEEDPPPVVLVADDEKHIVELVSLYLRRAGYRVETALDGEEALRKGRDIRPALLVLDIMMPGPDGLEICRKLRGRIPVLLLTARSSDIDKIAGLRLGADDYVTKPFNPDELVARVDAVLRRARVEPEMRSERVGLGDLEVDMNSRETRVCGRAVPLTPKEFELLAPFVPLPT